MSNPRDKALTEIKRVVDLCIEISKGLGQLESGESVLTVPEDKKYKSASDLIISNLPNIKPVDLTKIID